jgi:hypothetical protein
VRLPCTLEHVRAFTKYIQNCDTSQIWLRDCSEILKITPPLNLVSEFAHRPIQVHKTPECNDFPPLRKNGKPHRTSIDTASKKLPPKRHPAAVLCPSPTRANPHPLHLSMLSHLGLPKGSSFALLYPQQFRSRQQDLRIPAPSPEVLSF